MGPHKDKVTTLVHVGPGPMPRRTPKAKPRLAPPEASAAGGDDEFEFDDDDDDDDDERFVHLEPGQVIPGTRYEIISHIGDGGMGQVYEVSHLDIERRAALKILHPKLSRAPEAVKAFRDEARTASRVGAEQIVEIYDFIELPDGRVGFAMELLTGETLAEAIEHQPLAPDRALGILRQICKGLEAAHDAGVIHRDIKPENVVLQVHKGRRDCVKLLDFGIAAIMRDGVAHESMTAGTPLYLSPELICGEPFDHRADVYAFGCVAYEVLTGKSPFDSEDHKLASVLKKHLEWTPPSPREIRRNLPRKLSRVVMRCIAKEPDQRYADMAAVEVALCEAQIAAKLTTTWDDLAVPHNVDDHVRDRLLRDMPDATGAFPTARKSPRGWALVTGLSVLVAAGAVTALALRHDGAPPAAADRTAPDFGAASVDELVERAREAASQNYYVYPPSHDPSQVTAYAMIVRLESMQGPDRDRAMEQAGRLRQELSNLLVRLGDAYWQREEGRPYALDYYKQALVFDRSHPQAAERVGANTADIAALEAKAQDAAFTRAEMEAAEPLAALAAVDKNERKRRLAALQQRREAPAPGGAPSPPGPEDPTRTETLMELADADLVAPAEPEDAAPSPTDPVTTSGSGDRTALARATALTRQAKRQYAAGKPHDAAALLRQALGVAPHYVPALEALFDYYRRENKWSEAALFARRLTEAEPHRPLHFIRLGDARMKQGNPSAALDAYRNADALGSAKARTRVATLEEKLGLSSPAGPDEPETAPEATTSADEVAEPEP